MSDGLSRRAALKTLLTASAAMGAVAVLPAGRAAATDAAPALPHVGAQDPTAVALAYIEDAGKVDANKFPNYKAGQDCANCLQSSGGPKDEWRKCNLFPGKMVSSKGWCKVYVKRP
jgi:High potential iron-sulfur protein